LQLESFAITLLNKPPLVKIRFSYIVLKVLLSAFLFQLLALPVRAADSMPNNRDSFTRSSVAEILDSLVNATYFKDEHFSIPSKENEKFGFPSTFVPQYSDSVYASRIAALRRKTPINLVYNEHVRGFIRLYAVDRRGMTAKILGLAKLYFPLFEEKFDANNVPLEMKYLAIVESALNPTAVSSAGAKGLWQFMYGTGRMYGLQSSSFIEDRYDPYKASVAASRHLKDLYNIYGDWFLALAAYNSGPGNVNKAIRKAGGIKDYWAIWDYLPAETRGYVPAFIAVNYIMNYYNEHNIRPVEPGFLYQDIDTLRTTRFLSFEQMNETIGVPMRDLQFLNPQYKLGIIPAATSSAPNVIRLPRKYVAQFQKREDEIYAYKSPSTVEREGLYARLASINGGSRFQVVESGSSDKSQKIHVVQQGENLGSIARMYRIYISQLIAWNNLKDPDVTPGQKLIVFGQPDRSISSPVDSGTDEGTDRGSVKKTIERYRVGKGETLVSIARKNGTTVQRLLALNNLGSKKKVVPGQRLKVEREIIIKKSRSSSRREISIKKSHSSSRKVSADKHHKAKKEKPSRHPRKRRR
jgi:membrane-bound lytic murein transglycosylase D